MRGRIHLRAFKYDVLYLASSLSRWFLATREGAERNSLKTRALDYCLSVLTVWGQKHWLERGVNICISGEWATAHCKLKPAISYFSNKPAREMTCIESTSGGGCFLLSLFCLAGKIRRGLNKALYFQ